MGEVLKLILILVVICAELSKGNQHLNKKADKNQTTNASSHIATNKRPVNRATTECKDKAQNCRQLLGQCNDPSYVNILKANCQLTCGYCKRPSTKCENAFPDATCKNWERQGYCKGSAPLQQKRAYCSKTCNLCEGATPEPIDCTKPINKDKDECKKSKPVIDCTNPVNKDKEECKKSKPVIDCTDPRNADKPECTKGGSTGDKCEDENDLKSLTCLRSNCQELGKRYTPQCIRFCEDKKNKKKEWACKCAKKAYADDRCMPKFCKTNPTDGECQSFCDLEENRSVSECTCVKSRTDKACLMDTCKDYATYGTLTACITFCNTTQMRDDEPTCIPYATIDCSRRENQYKLTCLKADPFDLLRNGTDCTTATHRANINCTSYCSDPQAKFTKNCLDCAQPENRFHFNCLQRTCAADANRNDSTCKLYCQKVRGSAAPCTT